MRSVLKIVLVVLILGVGFGSYLYLEASKQQPRKQSAIQQPTLVETTEVRASQEPVTVSAMGVVTPARSVTVFPEVSGRIVYQSPRLVPGGRFAAGEIVVKIEAIDYELALKQQEARVVQARMDLARERGLKSVAEREWNLIRDEVQPTEEGKKLALRDIQLENAQAALDAAQGALDQSRRTLERTVIRAPFASVVTEEFVDQGQVVVPSTRIATLVATDTFWVQVSVPVDRLAWIEVPGVTGSQGSPVRVVQQAGSALQAERVGRVLKLLSDLDPRGKMARLLVEVDNPLGKPGQDSPSMPLLLGGNVDVFFQGPRMGDAIGLPRQALREQNRVWVMNADHKLEARLVEVVWTRAEWAFVRGDLRVGERVVTSRIATPIPGMLLQSTNAGESSDRDLAGPSPAPAPTPGGGGAS